MENRIPTTQKSSPLPVDFLSMVRDVFTAHFDEGLQAFGQLQGATAHFEAHGAIYPAEILLTVSLVTEGQLAATTVGASVDFDPRASLPTAQDLLNLCVDAASGVFQNLLDAKNPQKLEQLASESLSALEEVPFEWTSVDVEKRKVFVRLDKSNPKLDTMADDWLATHDPELKKQKDEEHQATEGLFVTGESARKQQNSGSENG